jgi:hypothetical protein
MAVVNFCMPMVEETVDGCMPMIEKTVDGEVG